MKAPISTGLDFKFEDQLRLAGVCGMNEKTASEFQVRHTNGLALCVGLAGLFIMVMVGILHFIPKKNPPVIPGIEWIIFGVGLFVFAAGFVMAKMTPLAMKISGEGIEFPRFNLFVPWNEFAYIDHDISGRDKPTIFQKHVIYFRFSKKFWEANDKQKFIQKGIETKFFNRKPHLCINGEFNTYGPFNSLFEMVQGFEEQMEAGGGEDFAQIETSRKIDPKAPLKIRKKSVNTQSRAYRHDSCGTETVISGRHFRQLANPLAFCLGTICVNCGESPLEAVQWTDTGEKVSDFRSRMFKHTSWILIILQFLIFPGLFSILTHYILTSMNPANGIWNHIGLFALGYVVGFFAIMATPLVEVAALIGGKKYWHYR